MKNILLIVSLSYYVSTGFSCDMCGATNTSLGLGVGAQGNRHTIGLSYQYRTYHSIHPPLFALPETQTKEYFHRCDLTGSIRISTRFQLKLAIPFVYNKQLTPDSSLTKAGLGDIQAFVNYFIINRSISDSSGIRQLRWSIGLGAKLPTGESPTLTSTQRLLFPGTGSWDPQAASTFYYSKNKWGILQQTQTIFRTPNRTGYQFGHAVSANLLALRKWVNYSAFAGTQFSWNGATYLNQTRITDVVSNGTIATLVLGGSYQVANILFQLNGELPYYQQLGDGNVHQKLSFSLGINYLFNE